MSRSILALAAWGLLFGVGQAKAQILAVDFATPPADFGSSIWNLGFEFQANSNATVTGLGNVVLSPFAQPQQVGLWSLGASGSGPASLLASTFVTSSGPLVGTYGDWAFNSITPVNLVAGDYYVVGGQGGADYTGETPITVNPAITYVQDLYTANGGLNSPLVVPTSSEGYDSPASAAWFGGNLEFGSAGATPTPEPGTLTLLGIGIAGIAGYSWRRRNLAKA
jgi:hypothetical protein